MDMIALRAAIRRDDTLTTAHAQAEAIVDGLHIDEIWASILDTVAEVVEDYPNDPRGPSCLILSDILGRPIHSVIGFPSTRHAAQLRRLAVAAMITVYRPDLRPHEWSSDYRTRLPRP